MKTIPPITLPMIMASVSDSLEEEPMLLPLPQLPMHSLPYYFVKKMNTKIKIYIDKK